MNANFESHSISRRSFLKASGVVGAASILAACGGSSSSTAASTSGAASGAAAPAADAVRGLAAAVGQHGNDVLNDHPFIVQLLLGQAVLSAQRLKILSECHGESLLCCPDCIISGGGNPPFPPVKCATRRCVQSPRLQMCLKSDTLRRNVKIFV